MERLNAAVKAANEAVETQNAPPPADLADITAQRDAVQQQVEELTRELQSLRELLADAIRAERTPETDARVQELTQKLMEELASIQQERENYHQALTLERQRLENMRERSSAPSPPDINP